MLGRKRTLVDDDVDGVLYVIQDHLYILLSNEEAVLKCCHVDDCSLDKLETVVQFESKKQVVFEYFRLFVPRPQPPHGWFVLFP